MIKALVLIMIFFQVPFLFAQQPEPSPIETAVVKSQVEQMITNQLDQSLRTTLKKGSYEVYAEVNISPKTQVVSAQSVKQGIGEVIPQDITLGVIDAEPLIRMYAKRVAELESNARSVDFKNYDIRSVNINLGLNGNYPDTYKAEMQDWLNRWSRNNLGKSAKSTVEIIREPKAEDSDRQPASNDDKKKDDSLLDKLAKMQLLLAAIALGGFLILMALIFSLVSRSNTKRNAEAMIAAQRAFGAAQAQGLAAAQSASQGALEESSPEGLGGASGEGSKLSDESVDVMRTLKEMKDMGQKIARVHNEIAVNMSQVNQLWLDSGKSGLMKFAAFMDNQMEDNPFSANLERVSIPEGKQKEMIEVFQEMAQMPLKERLKTFKDVYWDLMAVKTLGPEYLKRPFSYLSNVPVRELKPVVESQATDVQAMIVLNMPDPMREEYLKNMDLNAKKEIVQKSLSLDQVELSDVEMMSETVKNLVAGTGDKKATISTLPLSIKLLQGLNAYEEVDILRSAIKNLADRGAAIKSAYPTLAFMDEWKETSHTIFFEGLAPEQVITAIRTVPSAQQKILDSLPPRMKQIVSDDLQVQQEVPPTEIAKVMNSLRLRLNQLVSRGTISTETLYEGQLGERARAA